MSRATNFSLTQAEVVARCGMLAIAISAVEPLPAGGTHLVCITSEGADELRRSLKDHIIAGKVKRFPFMRSASSW